MARRILLIDEDASSQGIWEEAAGRHVTIDRVAWASFHTDALEGCHADLIAIVAVGAERAAIELFTWLTGHPILIPTLAMLPAEAGYDLVRAAADSVDDFVLWPVRETEWRQRIDRLLGAAEGEEPTPRDRLMEELALAKLVGRAPAFVRSVSRVPLIARAGSPVLITGETGTGKELFARAIHHLGPRARHPFIPVDCAALPDHLFENELFGHARGAFTDARTDQRGLIAIADGGTLFLDEVDALPLTAQAKLLRFLQERTFRPLGGERFVHANVNVLAATNHDLQALVRQRRFRSDLYFRLNVLSLHLAPLRLRRADIPLLARHFAETIAAEQNTRRKTLSTLAIRKLLHYEWPGNVRELHNVIQRAMVFAEGNVILPVHVTPGVADCGEEPGGAPVSFREGRVRAIEAFERTFAEELLERHGGNITRAAREARKDRRAFGRLVKKYGLQRGVDIS